MERQLRLAERRGLLTGPSLSAPAQAGLEILYFLDGQAQRARRRDAARAAAVAAGWQTPADAWPEYFAIGDEGDPAFPSAGADMSGFRLEEATASSFEADMEAMAAAYARVSVREEPDPEPPPGMDRDLPDVNWT